MRVIALRARPEARVLLVWWRWCCWWISVVTSTQGASVPKHQLSSRPARVSMPVGLSTRSCPSLLLPSARARAWVHARGARCARLPFAFTVPRVRSCLREARACVGVGVAPTSTWLQLGSGPARESMPVGLGTRACLSFLLSSSCIRAFLPRCGRQITYLPGYVR